MSTLSVSERTHIGDVDEGRSLLRSSFGRGGGPLHLRSLLQQHGEEEVKNSTQTITNIPTQGILHLIHSSCMNTHTMDCIIKLLLFRRRV